MSTAGFTLESFAAGTGSHQVDKWKAKAEALDEAGISETAVQLRVVLNALIADVYVYFFTILYIYEEIRSAI